MNLFIVIDFIYASAGLMDWNNVFSSFVNYVITKGAIALNIHFHPFWYRCSVCYLKPDFIGKTETMMQDKEYLVEKLGLDIPEKHMEKVANARGGMPTADATLEWFRNLTKTQVTKLYEVYRLDFEMFGYSIEPYYSVAKSD